MDLLVSLIALVTSIFCIMLLSHMTWIKNRANRTTNVVPEASGSWPIIGHLYFLATAGSQVPHRLLGSMADKFGPLFTIKLGVRRVVIVSNSEMAKECLTTNDRVFASRPKAMSAELMGYNYAIFSLTQNYSYWREIRKIVMLELMSHRHLEMLAQVRASEVEFSINDMCRTWVMMRNKGRGFSETPINIDMTQVFGDLILNMSVKMVFGNRFSPGQENGDRFKRVLRMLTELSSAFVPSDVIPGLRWLDLGGYEKKMKIAAKELDDIFEIWLEDHTNKINSALGKITDESEEDQVFMFALLSRVKQLKEDLYGFNINTIVKATCLTVLVAATDTMVVTLTWALSLLVNNPHVLEKAQQELDQQVGRERKVKELDLKNLVYLNAIIKETMRMYPAAPFLLPHESTEDCVVGGYTIPRGTQLLVNAWKIQHDPQIWSDPFEFNPERFLTCNKDIDLKGQHFELIPFGSGRRICVGMSFALETLKLTLGSIIHGFEFQNPSHHHDKIDMTESPGLTNLKATPLELLVSPRLLPYVFNSA